MIDQEHNLNVGAQPEDNEAGATVIKRYQDLTPEEKAAKVKLFLDKHMEGVPYKLVHKKGYIYILLPQNRNEENSPSPYDVDTIRLAANVCRRFIDTIVERFEKRGIPAFDKNDRSSWDKLYNESPEGLLKALGDAFRLHHPEIFEFEGTPAQENLDNVFKWFAVEHKIHLTPRPEMIFQTINILAKTMRDNPAFRDAVSQFKISDNYEEKDPDALPAIVIYPRNGSPSFQTVITTLMQKLGPHVEAWGNSVTPRFNSQGNKLIAAAQGGGDFKEALKAIGLLDRYFDARNNHAWVN